MEKLIYLLWSEGPSGRDTDAAFRDRLLSSLPDGLMGKGASQVKISVTDDAVEAGEALHLGKLAPSAMVSFWIECAHDRAPCEAILDRASQRSAGYLVVESHPLRTETPDGGVGKRMPGFSLVGCIEPATGVSQADFIDRWESVHRDVAIETQSTFSYIRNEVVRALTPDAPPWKGIVEEGFPIEALTDPRVFYDAIDSEQRFRENSGDRRLADAASTGEQVRVM
jgi:hypothetical protein